MNRKEEESKASDKEDFLKGKYFNFSQIISYLKEFQSRIDLTLDKKVIFFFSNTGAGKSTTINYLAGAEFKKIKTNDDSIREKAEMIDESKMITKIGKKLISETFFPEPIFISKDFLIIDCPGFSDTRGENERISTNLFISTMIKRALLISGFVIVIDYDELSTTRGESFRHLYDLLNRLFTNLEDVKNSVLFVFTKNSQTKEEDIFKEIQQIISELESTKEDPIISEEEISKIAENIRLLEFINARQGVSINLNIFENSDRERLLDRMSSLKLCNRSSLSLRFDPVRIEFDELISKIAKSGTEKLNMMEYYRISYMKDLVESTSINQIVELSVHVFDTIEKISQENEKKLMENNLELAKLKDLEKRAKEKQTEMNILEEKLKDLKARYNKLKNDQLVVFQTFEQKTFSISTKIPITYQSLPYASVRKNSKNGKFIEYVQDNKKGIYRAEFITSNIEESFFKVEICLKNQDIPENKNEIEHLETEINRTETELIDIKAILKKVNDLSEENKKLNFDSSSKDKFKSLIDNQLKKYIERNGQLIESKKNYLNNFNLYLGKFRANLEIYKETFKCLNIIEFEEYLKPFKIKYQDFELRNFKQGTYDIGFKCQHNYTIIDSFYDELDYDFDCPHCIEKEFKLYLLNMKETDKV